MSSHEHNLQLILVYNGVLNDVQHLSPLTTNMCPLKLEDDTKELVSMVHVESLDDDFNDNDNAFGMKMSSNYVDVNMEAFEVSKANVRTHLARHTELINDHIPMVTDVECIFSVESS